MYPDNLTAQQLSNRITGAIKPVYEDLDDGRAKLDLDSKTEKILLAKLDKVRSILKRNGIAL
jgi:hypothetical protein